MKISWLRHELAYFVDEKSNVWTSYSDILKGPNNASILCRVGKWYIVYLREIFTWTNWCESRFIVFHFVPDLNIMNICKTKVSPFVEI